MQHRQHLDAIIKDYVINDVPEFFQPHRAYILGIASMRSSTSQTRYVPVA